MDLVISIQLNLTKRLQAMGTEIQKYNPKPEDFPNNQEMMDGEWIKQIHRDYLNAGADCIETNSFGSNKIKLDEYGFGDQTIEFRLQNWQSVMSILTNHDM